jgi:hypothetical protein
MAKAITKKLILKATAKKLFRAKDIAFNRFLKNETNQGWEQFRRIRNWINRRPVMQTPIVKEIRGLRILQLIHGDDHGLAYPNGKAIPRWQDL